MIESLIIDEIPAPNPYHTDSNIFRINDLCRLSMKDREDIINIKLTRRKIELIKIVQSEEWQSKYRNILNMKPNKKDYIIERVIIQIEKAATTHQENRILMNKETIEYYMLDALGYDCK